MKRTIFSLLLFFGILVSAQARVRTFHLSDYGVRPSVSSADNVAPLVRKALERIRAEVGRNDKSVLLLDSGTYHFYPEGATVREFYISNHDQDNPKRVGICLEDWTGLTLDGQGARIVCHGQMLPFSLLRSHKCTLRRLSIDFQTPHIAQVEIVRNLGADGIVFRPDSEVQWSLTADSLFTHSGLGWSYTPECGMAFEPQTRHIVYRTSDIVFNLHGCIPQADGTVLAPRWTDERLPAGTRVAMRTYKRPAPGIFLSENTDTRLEDITVFYAEGMGLLAQLCENITLDRFNVCLKGDTDPRYYTTQADATHFSGCKGLIRSEHGLYENMMDDAINVHGTYLKITRRIDSKTLEACYMHSQSWGFKWGEAGDAVQFVRSRTMEAVGTNQLQRITPLDAPDSHGARTFRLTFRDNLPEEIDGQTPFGVENLTWTPRVIFRHNIVRNNRARGALFSTPRKVLCADNLFDHVSGCAILLCGDCNGWYETGACREVSIRHNVFRNVLTSPFQFTAAVISIYPEIPDLAHQKAYFHGGRRGAIRIEDNRFETFDAPLLYAKSVSGLRYRHNTVVHTDAYAPYLPNRQAVTLERVEKAEIEE